MIGVPPGLSNEVTSTVTETNFKGIQAPPLGHSKQPEEPFLRHENV